MSNKTIVNIAREYIKEIKLQYYCWDKINYMHAFKEMILPLELAGVKEKSKTEVYVNIESNSLLKQKISFPKAEKLKKKATETWKDFLK